MSDRPEPVGILGGTFDPVHVGHLHVAREVQRAFPLRQVRLVPCAIPPHKLGMRLTAAVHRLAMLKLASEDRRTIEIDSCELDRGDVSYTIDTLRAMAGGAAPITPVFILGWDALLELDTWMEYQALMAEFDLIVVDRREHAIGLARQALPAEIADRLSPTVDIAEFGCGGRIFHVGIPPIAVASRDIRDRLTHGRRLTGLVPPAVDRYIQQHQLYQEDIH